MELRLVGMFWQLSENDKLFLYVIVYINMNHGYLYSCNPDGPNNERYDT